MTIGAKILVIDDEPQIRKLLNKVLAIEGYQVLLAADGAKGLKSVQDDRPDLVILDLGLPDQEGQMVLKKIREFASLPVIILTVKDKQSDKVELLESGADDYLTKPFGIPELLARIKVAFRHNYSQSSEAPKYTFKSLEINFLSRIVSIDNTPIKLTATEYDLLKILAKNAGKIVTQQHLLKEIWGTQSVDSTHYLRIYISQLRKKIEVANDLKGFIITEPGVGYRLVDNSKD